MSEDGNTLNADQQTIGDRGYTLGILIAAIIAVELFKDIALLIDLGEWFPARAFVDNVVIACLPFLLASIAPKAAGFDNQWLPSLRRQWIWFLGLVVLLIVVKAFATVLFAALAATIWGSPRAMPLMPFSRPFTPMGIIFQGIESVFIAPIAEEIFFRGYLLEQLRKLTRTRVALLTHALLFGLFHLYVWGLYTPLALFASFQAFLLGLVFGVWRIKFRSLLPLILAHGLINAIGIFSLKDQYDEVVDRSHPKYTISKETTFIIEPLRKDGSVDYVAALNQRFSQDVTPKNNAAVLLWKAIGPNEFQPKQQEKYFQMLGIAPLPEKGDYFVDLDNYVAQQKKNTTPKDAKLEAESQQSRWEQLYLAMKRPWSPKEFPILAGWLAANEKPLALVVEASKRPRRYDPLCGSSVIAILLPDIQHYRDFDRALCARAMLRLNEGKLKEAWEDLLTCHRLARLAGQGPTVIEAVVMFSIEEMACAGDQVLLQHAHLTATQIAKMRKDLDRLPPMPKVVDKLDVAERFMYLNVVSDYSRQWVASLRELLAFFDDTAWSKDLRGPGDMKDTIKSLIHHSTSAAIDWDYILRMGNSWYDRIADAYRKPTRAERVKALNKIDKEIGELKKTAADAKSLDNLMAANPRKALSERVSQVLLTMFLQEEPLYSQTEDRWTMRFELDKLSFALAAYHADHDTYPKKLTDLAPRYVVEVPKDIFNNSELHYRLEGRGYLLYSVGVNGKDDGAKSYENRKKDEDWDDLVVRVPAPKQK